MQRSPRHFVVFWLFYAVRIQSCPLVKTLFERWTTCLEVIVILGRWLYDIMQRKRYAISSHSKITFLFGATSKNINHQSSFPFSVHTVWGVACILGLSSRRCLMPFVLCDYLIHQRYEDLMIPEKHPSYWWNASPSSHFQLHLCARPLKQSNPALPPSQFVFIDLWDNIACTQLNY